MHGREARGLTGPTNGSLTHKHCIFVPHNEGINGHMGIQVRKPANYQHIYICIRVLIVFQDKPPPSMARPSMPGTDSRPQHTCKQSIFSNAGYLTRVLQDHDYFNSDTPLPKRFPLPCSFESHHNFSPICNHNKPYSKGLVVDHMKDFVSIYLL